MRRYDERLEELRQQIARKNSLESILKTLRAQKQELEEKVSELESIMIKEDSDVQKLEGRSLAVFYYMIVGKRKDLLEKERQEAYAARVKYDVAVKELEAVKADLEQSEKEFRSLRWSEDDYQQTLKEKAKAICLVGDMEAEKVIDLEEKILYIENQKKELKEAIASGKGARSIADQIISNLDDADKWGTVDLIGGGMLSHMAKYSHLEDAQGLVENLQVQLRRFKTELADVTIHTNLTVNIDEFTRFADWFFDGLFVDWTVLKQISKSRSQIQEMRGKIQKAIHKLETLLSTAESEQQLLKYEFDRLVEKI